MQHRPSTRRAAAALLAMLCVPGAEVAAGRDSGAWVGAWGFPPTSAFTPAVPPTNPAAQPPANFDNVTVRQVVRLAAPAQRIRIRFSNEFGEKPLTLGAVHVALAGDNGATVPGSDHVVTFGGQAGVTIPANSPMLSDPVDWQLPALAQIAISSYVPGNVEPPAHRVPEYLSSSGNFTGAQLLPGSVLVRSGALVSQVEIVSSAATRVVVTLGDSITEGVGSTSGAFRGWPDRLAERLAANRATRDWSLVNAGIGSNRLLHNDPGRSALARFDRDVLGVPGVAMVIMLEGINDIGYGQRNPAEAVSAEEMIAAYRQLIERAHAHGIAIVVATIPPYEGARYFDQRGEQIRAAVNQWFRTGGAFDGVVEFDAALRDPDHPSQLPTTFHSGDHLHPSDAGYAAMANAIDLGLFKGSLLKRSRRR
jgi:lysophospholipase L1-like esterase